MTHWTPPNRGKTSTSSALSTGQFPTMGDELHRVSWVRPQGGQTASRQGLSKSGGNENGRNTHRSHRTTSASETYGPTGVVQVKRSLHGDGCACCASTGRYRMPSAFGEQEGFRSGAATGKKG
ncbi:hypothetical protein [Streptomyces sp. NPDC057002]|uniref:hypothetical protein n=1 Tax=Streptomyces sp. NPDC057002 TaxID=3345992 RepID=UPI00362FF4E5